MKNIASLMMFALALLAFSCSSAPVQRGGNEFVIKRVPFFPQEQYQCGPASLAGVLRYWGSDVEVGDIADAIFSKSARGTLTIDMLLYAQKKGFDSLQYAGDIGDLRSKVKAGYPLVVLVDFGFSVYRVDHFMVVVGYDDNGVIVNSGRSEKAYMPMDDFLKAWKKTNNWTLWIKPKEKQQSEAGKKE